MRIWYLLWDKNWDDQQVDCLILFCNSSGLCVKVSAKMLTDNSDGRLQRSPIISQRILISKIISWPTRESHYAVFNKYRVKIIIPLFTTALQVMCWRFLYRWLSCCYVSKEHIWRGFLEDTSTSHWYLSLQPCDTNNVWDICHSGGCSVNPKTRKSAKDKNSLIKFHFFCKILKNMLYNVKVLANWFHFNAHTRGFCQQTSKLKQHYMSP